MTNYEVLYILDASIADDEKTSFAERVQKIITDEGGEIGKVDAWGVKKLAYPIQKKGEGYYTLIEFQAGPELPKELDRRLRIADACLRSHHRKQRRALGSDGRMTGTSLRRDPDRGSGPRES